MRCVAREFLHRLRHCPLEGMNFSVDFQEVPTSGIVHPIFPRRQLNEKLFKGTRISPAQVV